MAEKHSFETYSKKILNMMVHSVYSSKDVFLREIISNASDALDKLRIESIVKKDLVSIKDQKILLEADSEKRTLSISDNGIGMNKDDLMNHLGTIAKSGTEEMEKLLEEKGENIDLIGQFGVGFYSVFMVSDEVEVLSKKIGEDKAYLWKSFGEEDYSIEEAQKEDYGTTITLHLKDIDEDNGIEDFTKKEVISAIIKHYSDFIQYPIVWKGLDEESKEIKEETLNSMQPIWMRDEKTLKEEDYNEFYKHVAADWQDPLKYIRYRAEGLMEYWALLYIPAQAPFDFFYQGGKYGLQLYVNHVLIEESFEDLLPHYLRFIKGIVDSSDLSLNISREMLQKDRHIVKIKSTLTKKVIDTFVQLQKKDFDKYLTFWSAFGEAIKEGVTSDFDNREKLESLLLFKTSLDEDKLYSLEEYCDKMLKDQKDIYYITGDSVELVAHHPQVESLTKKGYAVVYMVSPFDEFLLQSLTSYKDHNFVSITKDNFELGTEEEIKEEKEELETKQTEDKDFLTLVKDHLSDSVKEVKYTFQTSDSPSCILDDPNQMSAHLEKLLQNTPMAQGKSKYTLGLNPKNDIVKAFKEAVDKKDKEAEEMYSEVLLGYALIGRGLELPKPYVFNKMLLKLLKK